MTGGEQMLGLVDLEKDIERAIKGVIYRRGNHTEQFACKHDLQTVWGEERRLERLLGSHIPPEQLDFVCRNLIQTLSTLIWIGWRRWPRFQRIFLDHYGSDGKRDRLDDNLPIEDENWLADKSFLADSVFARHFLTHQHIFSPISIEEDDDQKCSKTRRLPFEGASGDLREGSYGQVSKEIVACRQFFHRNSNLELCPSPTVSHDFVVSLSFYCTY